MAKVELFPGEFVEIAPLDYCEGCESKDATIKELVEALEKITKLGNPWLMRQIAEKALTKHRNISENQ